MVKFLGIVVSGLGVDTAQSAIEVLNSASAVDPSDVIGIILKFIIALVGVIAIFKKKKTT